MFTFHKPKVFRSVNGCCICKAKSSSSRFTDSKRYEQVFEKCFDLNEDRNGEICNACVLLVKRFLKLPAGSGRHWGHVVDSRSGPGVKSVRGKQQHHQQQQEEKEALEKERERSLVKRKHVYKRRKSKHTIRQRSEGDRNGVPMSSFLDTNFWKSEKICCGTIFVGAYGEVAVDMRYLNPCAACRRLCPENLVTKLNSRSSTTSSTSTSSSDHGVDMLEEPSASQSTRLKASSSDVDEGFFDKPLVSPSSLAGSSSCSNSEDNIMEEVEDEEEEDEVQEEEEEEEIDDDEEQSLNDGGGEMVEGTSVPMAVA